MRTKKNSIVGKSATTPSMAVHPAGKKRKKKSPVDNTALLTSMQHAVGTAAAGPPGTAGTAAPATGGTPPASGGSGSTAGVTALVMQAMNLLNQAEALVAEALGDIVLPSKKFPPRKQGESFVLPMAGLLRADEHLARLSGADPDRMEAALHGSQALVALDNRMVVTRQMVAQALRAERTVAWTDVLRVYRTARTVEGNPDIAAQVQAFERFMALGPSAAATATATPGTPAVQGTPATHPASTPGSAQDQGPAPGAHPAAPDPAQSQGPATR